MNLQPLFDQFLKERIYLKNITYKTQIWHKQCWSAFQRYGGTEFTKQTLITFVVNMRDAGVKPVSCNIYIGGVNAFLLWLHENEHLKERLRIKLLKEEKKVIKPFSETQLKAIINFRPKKYIDMRLHAMLCLIIDTGARIDEVLSLKRENVDFDNMLVKLMGKGQKERIIPISVELRKIFYRFNQKALTIRSEFFFPVRGGGKVSVYNFWRDMRTLCKSLGIEGVRISAHTLRHTFALNYARNGGNLFALQKMLGHETLAMTRRYCELQTEDLQAAHLKTSLLNKLR